MDTRLVVCYLYDYDDDDNYVMTRYLLFTYGWYLDEYLITLDDNDDVEEDDDDFDDDCDDCDENDFDADTSFRCNG